MLHEFVSSNRDELVRRCRSRVSERVLEQLVRALRGAPAALEVSRTAALHGKALREQGYTAGQVVQDYADIANTIAELAAEHHAAVTAGELETLNRFLDSAIADAVASYGGLTKSRELFARH